MMFIEIKKRIKKSLVWSYLKRNELVYYAWIDGEKYLLNKETVNDIHKILDSDTKDYSFYIEK